MFENLHARLHITPLAGTTESQFFPCAGHEIHQISNMKTISARRWIETGLGFCVMLALVWTGRLEAQERSLDSKLEGFDDYMAKVLKDWNAPGVGVGIVFQDKLVFAKGYGYRDYGKKLPFTPKTLCPIASNTKLFTAVAAGMLVKEGKLDWDKPIRDAVPSIRFFNNELNNTITLRDMLSHRTGITRHDSIWYKSDFTRRELFERLQFMEPKEPPRQVFLYNNLMYAAAGYIIELKSGKTWEDFVRERILHPLEMTSTVYSIPDMTNAPDFGVPFTEKRDSRELYRLPYYEDTAGVGPCGAIISSIEDMSHWLVALMNEGRYNGQPLLPPEVLAATLEPAMALPNVAGETRGFWEVLNTAYGMGRDTAAYRGHLLTYHGGALGGFFSQVSFMPQEHCGVIVFVIGEHCSSLVNTVSYNIYERLLDLSLTPWSERQLDIYQKDKKAGTEGRAKAGSQQVLNTKPSHALEAYAGEYEHPAYGILKIALKGDELQFDFHKIRMPLSHFHYDRFDTPDDELDGKWSVNFATNPQGEVDKATMALDEAEATFVRKPETLDPQILQALAGAYKTPTGATFHVVLKKDGNLYRVSPGQPEQEFLPYRGLKFRVREFSDLTFEFLVENGRPSGLKVVSPSGDYLNMRAE
jgi:CubicO group peptidase (beta-lactamase class C family)